MNWLKKLALWGLVGWLISAMVGCGSIPDPSDEQRLTEAMAALSPDEQAMLRRAGVAVYRQGALEKAKRRGIDDVMSVTCTDKTGKEVTKTIKIESLIEVFGTHWFNDSLESFIETAFTNHVLGRVLDGETNCKGKPNEKLFDFMADQEAELDRLKADDDAMTRQIVAYILIGAVVVAAIGPLLPVLCVLSSTTHVYCPDNVPPGNNPAPPPVELPQDPGDHL